MAYKKGQDRRQRVLFPDCIDEYVESDAPVRLFDAFVDSLKMDELEFIRSTPAETGTPGYDPRDLLKLYIYGYFYQVRSSRKLARECKCNVEVMWLLNKLTPDFRTISDFRKDNKKAITKVYKEFNKFCMGLKLFSKSYISIDGSKFKAVNAKDNNLTLNKLDDRIKRLDEHISIYMEELDAYDHEEGRKLSKDELQRKLDVCKERKERYEGYRDTLEKSGESQISLTDPDSRLMKANEGFCVGYNVQTAVDAGSHMIAGFQVTDSPTDHGLITSVASEVKADYGVEVLETTADKGYECPEDHADALANGIIPNVIQRDGGCTEQVQFNYNEATITDAQKASTKPEDMKACLEAGVIPDTYKDILTDVHIAEIKEYSSDVADSAVLHMTPEQMRAKALEGYFVRDAERNLNSKNNTTMNLTKIKNECYDAMVEAIKSELDSEGIDCASYAFATVDTNDGYIELSISRYDTSVVIVHDNDNEHDCPLLCTAIEKALPDWYAIEDEWQAENPEEDEYEAHGFRDEADYLNWKYG